MLSVAAANDEVERLRRLCHALAEEVERGRREVARLECFEAAERAATAENIKLRAEIERLKARFEPPLWMKRLR